ncbi:TetR family transcriptional regulator [Micromonospora sp. STR1s_5]|nr:TetR family transcriptional regulator [Micromonospora sp. STR1s_5]
MSLCAAAARDAVRRNGAARLTLDAVAAEAKISKASVLYDYKTKVALITAVIERRVAAENERIQSRIRELGAGPDAVIRGRIAAASRSVSDADRAVAVSLCAAAARDAALRAPIQDAYRHWTSEIARTSTSPRGALLAFLALEGLMLMEWFGLQSWPERERERLLAEIEWLLHQSPGSSDEAPAAPVNIATLQPAG